MQCERNKEKEKRKIREKDKIYIPEEYNEMIRIAKNTGYSVTNISPENTLDFKNWWPKYYKNPQNPLIKVRPFPFRNTDIYSILLQVQVT
jgi:hypothetical protein